MPQRTLFPCRGIAACVVLVGLLSAAQDWDRVQADETQTSIGEIPLCDLGTGTVHGFQGGLYPKGSNTRPAGHEAAGLRIARVEVTPRNTAGTPDPDGKIVLI